VPIGRSARADPADQVDRADRADRVDRVAPVGHPDPARRSAPDRPGAARFAGTPPEPDESRGATEELRAEAPNRGGPRDRVAARPAVRATDRSIGARRTAGTIVDPPTRVSTDPVRKTRVADPEVRETVRTDPRTDRSSRAGVPRAHTSPVAALAPAHRSAADLPADLPAIDPAGARPTGPLSRPNVVHGSDPATKPIPAKAAARHFRRLTCSVPVRSWSRVGGRSRRSSPRAAPPIASWSSRNDEVRSSSSSCMPRACASRSSRSRAGR
jgi:hypothetical protein